MKFSIYTIILLLQLFICNQLFSQSNAQADSSTISRQFSKFQQALLNRDTLLLGDFYADDAISLLQNQPVRRGRELIVQRWKKSLSNPILIHMMSAQVNVSASGQDAFQFGFFEIHTADSSNTLLASGKIMFLWKKQPSGWRITLEMDNFNSPQSQKSPGQTKQ